MTEYEKKLQAVTELVYDVSGALQRLAFDEASLDEMVQAEYREAYAAVEKLLTVAYKWFYQVCEEKDKMEEENETEA